MTIIVICLGPKSIMSLVRMCTVTVSLFRMCMCMCLRARERERRETSSRGLDADQAPELDLSKADCIEKGELELSITTEHLQLSANPLPILAGLSRHPFVEAGDLKSILGPYSPKRQLAERKESQQNNFTPRHLKSGLLWLSNSIDEHHAIFSNGVKRPIAEQGEPGVTLENAEEVDRQFFSSSAASPAQTHTIAWSECESCVVESTSCIADHHELMGERKHSVEVVLMEEKLYTLVDELVQTDESKYTYGTSCPTDFGPSCQCSQLPNQILATPASSCTI